VHATIGQAATPAGPPKGPLTKEERVELGMVYLIVVVLFTLGILAWVVIANAARARRRRAEAEARGRPPRVVSDKDPWEEAAKRVRTPSSSELEDTAIRGAIAPGASPEREAGESGRPVVLITGAAKRVGRAVALRMARAGCDVFFTYHQSGEEAESLARELSELGSMGSFYQIDLTDPAVIEDFARDLAASMNRLDVLVHNASVYSASPLQDVTLEDVMRQYQVNAAAPLLLTARLAPLLMQSEMKGGASVVCFTDIHSMGRPRKDFAAYSMSKAAVTEMVYSLARDLGPEVRVNAIAPGVVAWPEEGADADPEMQRKYVRRIPLGRPGTPDDAAEVVRWLAFDATYLTGEIIRVDGGRWLT